MVTSPVVVHYLSNTNGATISSHITSHDGLDIAIAWSLSTVQPALAREIAFYTHVASASRHSSIGMLRPFLPKFYGTLRLEGRQEGGRVVAIDGAGEVPEVSASRHYGRSWP